jgi:hypothetical protein
MALCIAQVAAAQPDLTDPDALDAIAQAFVAWRSRSATDIGNQTSAILSRASRDDGTRISQRMTALAESAVATGQAGNLGLMRTAVVGLCALHSTEGTLKQPAASVP